ncbi:MAG: VIT1/CCC1 transporter family protein [Pseudomonadota bacterium]
MEHGHSFEEIQNRIGQPGSINHLKDIVFGGIDGAVTTFAIVAGVQGAGLSPAIIVILGIANVFADGFSMAMGNYLGTKSERDDIARIREIESRHIRDVPEGETNEIRRILQLKGLEGQTLDDATLAITRNKEAWIDMMLVDEYGKSPVNPEPVRSAGATFLSFFVCGLVPVLPFLVGMDEAFLAATIATTCTFFAIGMLKSVWSLASWWRSGLETTLIGSAAAGIAYAAGYAMSKFAN